MKIKNLLNLLRITTSNDIVSVLNRYFQKINLMYENDLVALYHTVSCFHAEENDPKLSKLIPTIQGAIISRMIQLISIQQEKIAENSHYYSGKFESSTAEQMFNEINGPLNEKIRTMRKTFYAVTNDGSFFET